MSLRASVMIMALLNAAHYSAALGADAWPTKTVRVIAAGAAGGPIDILARVVDRKSTRLNSSHT